MRFPVERRRIKPVQRLRDGEQVARSIFQRQVVGRRHDVANARVRRRVRNLRFAGVRRDDPIEERRKRHGGLAVARRDVRGEGPSRRLIGEALEERLRVARPVGRVGACMSGKEVIGRVHGEEG